LLPIRRAQYFTGYFQSLDTDSCELIVIDRHRGAHFRSAHHSFCQRNCASAHIFGRRFCIGRRPRLAYNGKSAKVLSMANCGMGAAVGIGVIP